MYISQKRVLFFGKGGWWWNGRTQHICSSWGLEWWWWWQQMWRLCEKQQKLLSPAIDSNYCGVLVEFLSIMPHQISRQLFNTLSAFTTLILLLAGNLPTHIHTYLCSSVDERWLNPSALLSLLSCCAIKQHEILRVNYIIPCTLKFDFDAICMHVQSTHDDNIQCQGAILHNTVFYG